jgi:hypothetical protein
MAASSSVCPAAFFALLTIKKTSRFRNTIDHLGCQQPAVYLLAQGTGLTRGWKKVILWGFRAKIQNGNRYFRAGHGRHAHVYAIRKQLDYRAMLDFGKFFVFLGLTLLLLGGLLLLLGRTNLPLGRLPGDILYRGKNTTFYFPLATSILISVVLSLVLYVVGKFRH